MNTKPVSRESYVCKPCNQEFPTWDLLWAHKSKMRRANRPRHDSCTFCDQIFRNEAAELQHVQRHHPAAQRLHCPGCGMAPFTRVGCLISHIENGECRVSIKDVEEMRAAKLSFTKRLEELTLEPVKSNFAKFMTPSDTGPPWTGTTEPETPQSVWSEVDFPELPDKEGQRDNIQQLDKPGEATSDVPFQGAWGGNDIAAAVITGPAAVRPTPEELEAATTPGPRMAYDQMDIDDLNHPSFNAARYQCEITEKYNCPKVGCGKSFKKPQLLVDHLKSPAHGSTTYLCPGCHRLFKSLSAIASHAETATTRCRISASRDYPAFMDQLTAGIVQVDQSVHIDGTAKYSVDNGVYKDWKEKQSQPSA